MFPLPLLSSRHIAASDTFFAQTRRYASMIWARCVHTHPWYEQDAYLCIHDMSEMRTYASMIFEWDTYFYAYIYLNENSMIEEERYRCGPVEKSVPTLTVDILSCVMSALFNPFPLAEKKKIGEKIKKLVLPRPPSNAADRNFWRNHTSPGHKNWDALSRERVL